MPDMKPKFPLRERRKQIIRDSLTDAALKLFGERGYINVTLEEVAEKAVVHVQTVYKYFKTKENLALAVAIDGHDIVRKLIQNPNRTEEVSSVWRNHALARLSQFNSVSKKPMFLQIGAMIIDAPNLKSQNLAHWKRTETLLTIQLAKDADKDPEKDLHSRLQASMLISSYLDVLRRWSKSNGCLNARKLYMEALDYIDQNFVRPDDREST